MRRITLETLFTSNIIKNDNNNNSNSNIIPIFSESDLLLEKKNKKENKRKYVASYYSQSAFQIAPDASQLPMPHESFFL
jgi:hypothetical protein